MMYPQPRPDGKWVIGHDDTWNEVVVDDIEGIDPSQFQNDDAPSGSGVAFNSSVWPSEKTCTAVVPYNPPTDWKTSANTPAETAATATSNSEPSTRPNSPDRPSQNLDWPSINATSSGPSNSTTSMSTTFNGWTTPISQPSADFGPGVRGLSNLGNTCFMNAGLQCLLNNALLVKYFLAEFPLEEDRVNLPNNSLAASFVSLFDRVWNCKQGSSPIRPTEFKDSLGQSHSQFRDFRQHDCQEFLALLLGTLQEQLNPGACRRISGGGEHCGNINAADLKGTASSSSGIESTSTSPESAASPSDNLHEQLAPLLSSAVTVETNGVSNVGSGTDSPKSSDSSSASSTASSVDLSGDNSFRSDPLPSDVAPFEDPQLQSNIISLDKLVNRPPKASSLRPDYIVHSSPHLEMAEMMVDRLNNETVFGRERSLSSSSTGMDDLTKQVKIPNPNLLVVEETNNQITFDSSKFPKTSSLRKADIYVDNLSTSNQERSTRRSRLYDDISSLDNDQVLNGNSVKRRNKSSNVLNGCLNKDVDMVEGKGDDVVKQKKKLKTSGVYGASSTFKSSPRGDDSIFCDDDGCLSSEDEGTVEWKTYLSRNRSSIVKTFHGQFKSSVQCFKCNHVSVTFEPFMYLPVPLPHALEKQLYVTYVSCSRICFGKKPSPPIRYLIDVHKYDKLSKVIELLKELLRKESIDPIDDNKRKIVLAEVKDNVSVERVLDDSTMVRFSSDQNLYAFDLPFHTISDSILPDDQQAGFSVDSLLGNNVNSQDNFPTIDNWDPSDMESLIDILTPPEVSTPNVSPLKPNEVDESGSDWPTSQGADSGIEEESPANKKEIVGNFGGENEKFAIDLPVTEPASRTEEFITHIIGKPVAEDEDDSTMPSLEDPKLSSSSSSHQCCVCLEHKSKEELLSHPCSCVICTSCIDRHAEINPIEGRKDRFACPTCNQEVSKNDYVGLEQPSSLLSVVRSQLLIPILFRMANKDSNTSFKLVSHPVLVQLPNQIPCNQLLEAVGSVVPFPLPYSLHFVSSNGQKCSRCLESWDNTGSSNDCTGCEIARFGVISLSSGDNIAVQFDLIYEEELEAYCQLHVEDHPSVKKKRSDESLTLDDCIRAFHESEILDEDNPWFCPSCQSNQKAKKSLSIWRAPETLMVYLKRFIFHDMMPVKVDDPVSFPLQGLDLSGYTQGPLPGDGSLIYDLDSVVCHHGGVNAGHYTSFVKHFPTGKWLYFNDSTVTVAEPSANDERAYVLFYRRTGREPISIDVKTETDDEPMVTATATEKTFAIPSATVTTATVTKEESEDDWGLEKITKTEVLTPTKRKG